MLSPLEPLLSSDSSFFGICEKDPSTLMMAGQSSRRTPRARPSNAISAASVNRMVYGSEAESFVHVLYRRYNCLQRCLFFQKLLLPSVTITHLHLASVAVLLHWRVSAFIVALVSLPLLSSRYSWTWRILCSTFCGLQSWWLW